jgi:hypothetical protein
MRRIRRHFGPGPLVLLGLCLACACDLSEADVVARSPDVAPAADLPADATPTGRRDAAVSSDGQPDSPDDTTVPPDDGLRDQDAPDDLGAPADGSADAGDDGAGRADTRRPCTGAGVVFCDDFATGAAAWQATGATWQTRNFNATSPGHDAVYGPTEAVTSQALVVGAFWQDTTVEAAVYVLTFGGDLATNRVEIYARYQAADRAYALSLRGDGKLGLRKNGIAIGNTTDVAAQPGQWSTLKLTVSGQQDDIVLAGYLDGELAALAADPGPDTGGASSSVGLAGLGVYGEARAVFDDVRVSAP